MLGLTGDLGVADHFSVVILLVKFFRMLLVYALASCSQHVLWARACFHSVASAVDFACMWPLSG